MSERTDSQIIHEARGLCWHKGVKLEKCCESIFKPGMGLCKHRFEGDPMWVCPKCKEGWRYYRAPMWGNPDYTDPTAYLEAMAWAMERDWWDDALKYFWSKLSRNGIWDKQAIPLFMLGKEEGSHALAEYIKEKCNCTRPRRPDEVIKASCPIHSN